MLGTIIFGPDGELADLLYRRCSECHDLSVYKIMNEYPPLHVLVRMLNGFDPQVILLELGDNPRAWEVAHDIISHSPRTAIVGYTRKADMELPPDSGIHQILHEPFSPAELQETLVKALEGHRTEHRDNVLAFLPAKAGSGATTIALNIGGALARFWRQKVLIIEADLHSGCLTILLKRNPSLSVVDALENADSLSEKQWERLLVKAEGLDLLLTPRDKKTAIVSPWDYQQLLSFASPRYDVVIVDLPEVINDATEAVVRRAKQVYVVCTPELPSLFLARRRALELSARGVEESRLGLALNRYAEMFESVDEIEELLNRKVSVVFPNDFQRVREAALGEGLVDETSALGRAYLAFAETWAGEKPKVAPPEEVAAAGGRAGSMKSFFAENLKGLLGRG